MERKEHNKVHKHLAQDRARSALHYLDINPLFWSYGFKKTVRSVDGCYTGTKQFFACRDQGRRGEGKREREVEGEKIKEIQT